MCRCDDNPPEMYNHATRKAHKPHRCEECRRTIAVGETHDVHSGRWEDGFETIRWCEHCSVAIKGLLVTGILGCYCFGEVWTDVEENRPYHRSDRWVARLLAMSRRRWTRRRGLLKGTRYPVSVAMPVSEKESV